MIPHALCNTTKKEVDRLEKEVALLSRNKNLNFLPACFIIPKKDQTVRFITDFRRLNKMIVRKPYPLPNIQETLTTIGNFTYATVVDLVMGYYHMKVRKCQEIMWHSTTMRYIQLQYAPDGFVYCY